MSSGANTAGALLGFLVGKLAKNGVQGYTKAKQAKSLVNTYNQGLPHGYQINYDPGNFFFGDVGALGTSLERTVGRKMDQAALADINAHLPAGSQQFGTLEPAKSYYTGAVIPESKAGMERTREVGYADPVRNLIETHPESFFPGMWSQSEPGGPKQGVMDDGTGRPMIQTGAGRTSGLPDFGGMTGEEILKVMGDMRATSGENRALEENQRKTELHPLEMRLKESDIRSKEAGLKKTLTDIKRIEAEIPWIGPKARAYIAAMNRPRGGGGHAPNIFEVLGALSSSGELPRGEYIQAIKALSGLEPKAGTGNNGFQTDIYDSEGNLTKRTVRKPVGRSAPIAPGGTVIKGATRDWHF